MKVKTDCRFFKGDVPCQPHKDEGVHCEDCIYYSPVREKILIIKLGAMGDVIRTTPLVTKLRDVYPQAEISWLTNYPEVIPTDVDRIYQMGVPDTLTLLANEFDILFNLDKDPSACSLSLLVKAKVKKGFTLQDGKCAPIDRAAYHKWLTGIFDDVNRKNTMSYMEEIFEICGFQYKGEEYILETFDGNAFRHLKQKSPLVGLNTGCGSRWKTRLWPEEHWIDLAKQLKSAGLEVVLLTGPEEEEKNKRIAKASGGTFLGHFPVRQFASLVGQCDVVVTGVTMALHVALALKRKVVLLNNVFNANEFDLCDRGIIVQPDIDCVGCYKTSCTKECMGLIKPADIARICERLLGHDVLDQGQ